MSIDWSTAQEAHRAPVLTTLDVAQVYLILCDICRGDYDRAEYNFQVRRCVYCAGELDGE
jgi:uncharacterized CHY-type Zn-finger protein